MLGHSHPQLKQAKYVVFVDSDRQYIDCSEGVCHLVGDSRKNILDKRIDDLSYGVDRVPHLFAKFLRQGNLNGEHIIRQSNGAPLPIRYCSYFFSDGCKAATWEVITDWRAAYLTTLTSRANKDRGVTLDVALAAIYQRLSAPEAPGLASDDERSAVVDALSELQNLSNQSEPFQNAGSPGFDKTTSALLRLADNVQDTEATQMLLQENRVLLAAALRKWFGLAYSDRTMLDLVDRLANRARYYDPEVNPVIWLNTCLDLECRRLLSEMKRPLF